MTHKESNLCSQTDLSGLRSKQGITEACKKFDDGLGSENMSG